MALALAVPVPLVSGKPRRKHSTRPPVGLVPASLAGLPAMSVPGGLDSAGLPLGLHLIGNELDEQGVFNAGLAIEERSGFTARAEKWW